MVRVNQQVLIGCPVEEVATADNRTLGIEIERCALAWMSHLEAVVEGVPDAAAPCPRPGRIAGVFKDGYPVVHNPRFAGLDLTWMRYTATVDRYARMQAGWELRG